MSSITISNETIHGIVRRVKRRSSPFLYLFFETKGGASGFKSLVSWLAARSKDDVSTEGDIRKHKLGKELGSQMTSIIRNPFELWT
jgi:hypothetical protein